MLSLHFTPGFLLVLLVYNHFKMINELCLSPGKLRCMSAAPCDSERRHQPVALACRDANPGFWEVFFQHQLSVVLHPYPPDPGVRLWWICFPELLTVSRWTC